MKGGGIAQRQAHIHYECGKENQHSRWISTGCADAGRAFVACCHLTVYRRGWGGTGKDGGVGVADSAVTVSAGKKLKLGLHGDNVRGGLYVNLNWILWSLDSGRIKYVSKSAREINLNSCV